MRRSFTKGGDNDWEGIFSDFSDEIEKNLKDPNLRRIIEADFSTTGTIDRIVSQISLMDTVKHYFEYKMRVTCGIPSIELAGTQEDWEKLRTNAEYLLNPAFGLEFWTRHLFPILDNFVDAFKNPEINTEFWSSIIAHHARKKMCGEKADEDREVFFLTGWIQDFFPYLRNEQVSSKLGSWKEIFSNSSPLQCMNG